MKGFRFIVALTAATLVGAALNVGVHAQEQKTATVAQFGGAWQVAVRKAIWEPIFNKLGYVLKEDSLNGIVDIRLQVQGGRPTWDIVGMGIGDCVAGEREGLFETLDYSVLTNAKDFPPSLRGKTWVGGLLWSTFVITWNKNKYGANHPNSWKDYFDVQKFPGRRAGYNAPRFMIEAAVMADGVPKEKVYPVDLDRAFKKLREFKKHVTVWYKTFGQGTQLMKDNEVDIVPMFDGRAMDVIDDGAPWDFTFNQGITNADCETIVKGAPHKEAAMRVLNEALDPVIQANLPKYFKYGPLNPKAYETGLISPEVARRLNSHPENWKLQLELDAQWYGDNLPKIQALWDKFIQE